MTQDLGIAPRTDYVDVTFPLDGTLALDPASITDTGAEFTLTGPGVAVGTTIGATPTLLSGSTWRYTLSQRLLSTGDVTLTFITGSWQLADTAPGTTDMTTVADSTTIDITFPDGPAIDTTTLNGDEFFVVTASGVVNPVADHAAPVSSGRPHLHLHARSGTTGRRRSRSSSTRAAG